AAAARRSASSTTPSSYGSNARTSSPLAGLIEAIAMPKGSPDRADVTTQPGPAGRAPTPGCRCSTSRVHVQSPGGRDNVHGMRQFLLLTSAMAVVAPAGLAAQRADSARADSARTLDQVRVTVTRAEQTAQRTPWAVDVIRRDAIRRAQATVGIDEALNNVPGVIVSNRYNASVDQRLSIRGAGARANFGIRGVKTLLDGVPQSLPDGQNQLTNVDLADIARVEVLRGSASSLYGNGSGGVIAFETDRSAPDPFSATARATSGSFGLSKVQGRAAGRSLRATTSLSVSRTRST